MEYSSGYDPYFRREAIGKWADGALSRHDRSRMLEVHIYPRADRAAKIESIGNTKLIALLCKYFLVLLNY